jgi:formylglycine-generating enzyme required for sulfatase activity
MEDAEHAGLRSGICLAVGSIQDMDAQMKQLWGSLLTDWYAREPDAGTHSAAGWALRQWKIPEPPVNDVRLRGKERDWIITQQTGLTMVRIRAGPFERHIDAEDPQSKKQIVRIIRDFLLSDREITIDLFRRFINDKEFEGDKPDSWEGERKFAESSPAHPVQQVSWYDAVMFCNWLSSKEGLRKCYKLSENQERTPQAPLPYDVEITAEADGFRLPTDAEWEYACRAGTATQFAFGDEKLLLSRYGVYELYSNSQTAQVGTRMCNAWGLFDMHGNIMEWCQDRYDLMAGTIIKKGSCVLRGGSWTDGASGCPSASRIEPVTPVACGSHIGFRVASCSVDAIGK